MKDYESKLESSFYLWSMVGVGSGTVLGNMIGSLTLGISMGLCAAFLLGICCKRFISKSF